MASNTRIPKAELTGIYGAMVKRMSRKMLGDVAEPVEVAWHNRKVLNFSFSLGRKAQKWDQCDELPAAVRQIAHRAREHVAARRPRIQVDPAEQQQVVDRFLAALRTGDLQVLFDVLAPDVVLVADGGGEVAAVRRPVVGGDRVATLLSRFKAITPDAVVGLCGSTARPPPGSISPASSTRRSAWWSRTAGSPASTRSATRTSSPGWTKTPRLAADRRRCRPGPRMSAGARFGPPSYARRLRVPAVLAPRHGQPAGGAPCVSPRQTARS
jgi:RNA polymerase sigma-70 factor (ECF subfamily)